MQVTLDFQADIHDDVPEHTVRIIMENCRILKFEVGTEFEEE